MSYKKDQKAWLKQTGLKVGDKVRVIAKAESQQCGWNNSWEDEMDSYVGSVQEIKSIYSDIGIHLGGWRFPFFVLAKYDGL